MSLTAEQFVVSLDERVNDILDACTKCGACASVCPTPKIAGLTESPEELGKGIVKILQGETITGDSKAWAELCCGSGFCQSVCEEGINPRFMLSMARRAINSREDLESRRIKGKKAFQKMSRGVRVLSRLQLAPDILERLSPKSHPGDKNVPDVVFYTGCNMLKTPHIGLLCLDILERLDFTYEVHGGPSTCCGILQFRPGDVEGSARQALKSIEKLTKSKSSRILSWCPTCQIQFSEVALPTYEEILSSTFNMTMFPNFLLEHLEKLKPLLQQRVEKRVALHEYSGELGVVEAVKTLLDAIPGLEVVDLGHRSAGYTGTALAPMKDYLKKSIKDTLLAAEKLNVDILVGIYHNDHREFSGHEAAWNFKVANYMELLGESMGLDQPDIFKQFKLMGDVDAIIEASSELILQHDLDVETLREVIIQDMLDDQQLPVEKSQHPQ
ncbi:MAG: (Fe-S)-binding protein [Pseudomonadota bacterium]|jgi:heterodisulfide reductase subunit D|nr:(Fe-S)-binding protein [Pseudomonadota bacterium]